MRKTTRKILLGYIADVADELVQIGIRTDIITSVRCTIVHQMMPGPIVVDLYPATDSQGHAEFTEDSGSEDPYRMYYDSAEGSWMFYWPATLNANSLNVSDQRHAPPASTTYTIGSELFGYATLNLDYTIFSIFKNIVLNRGGN